MARQQLIGAAAKLEESHRLSQGADFVNLAHLGDLNVVLKQPDKAREAVSEVYDGIVDRFTLPPSYIA